MKIALFILMFGVMASHGYAGQNEASDYRYKIQALYEELQRFKNDPVFHRIGFGTCCRFNKWMKKVENLKSQDMGININILIELGFFPGDLIQLGMEYMRTKGRANSYIHDMEATILRGFKAEN